MTKVIKEPKIKVERFASDEDLGSLVQGDVLGIHGIRGMGDYVVVHHNDTDRKILNLFGKGEEESIQWMIVNYLDTDIELGQLVINNADIDTLRKQHYDSLNPKNYDKGRRGLYDYSEKVLREKGLW